MWAVGIEGIKWKGKIACVARASTKVQVEIAACDAVCTTDASRTDLEKFIGLRVVHDHLAGEPMGRVPACLTIESPDHVISQVPPLRGKHIVRHRRRQGRRGGSSSNTFVHTSIGTERYLRTYPNSFSLITIRTNMSSKLKALQYYCLVLLELRMWTVDVVGIKWRRKIVCQAVVAAHRQVKALQQGVLSQR